LSWNELNAADGKAAAKVAEEQKLKAIELAKAYSGCFSTSEGKRVLEDLTARFIYGNDTPFESQNVNYEAAYHNGEAGVIKYVINLIQQAKVRG
jgi:hypothetical protein